VLQPSGKAIIKISQHFWTKSTNKEERTDKKERKEQRKTKRRKKRR
jgi:hypothetical protein